MRELLAEKAIALLQKHCYSVDSFLQSNSCFDIAAKRGKEILLLKVFGNIDGLREEQATELKRLAVAFNATALILGEKTKKFLLKDNSVYERYGLRVLTINSFSESLKKEFPTIHVFKGKETVQIDSALLKSKRERLGLTLSELAERIDASVQAMHRYENEAHASLTAARKLEQALKEKLVCRINVFENTQVEPDLFEEKSSDDSFARMQELGLKLALFDHAPFRAYSNPEEALLIDKGYSKQELKKKALVLEKARTIVHGHSVIISKETKYERIGNTSIIQEEELESFSKPRDLLETIKEREKKKRK